MELPTCSATSSTPMTGSLWWGETPRYGIFGHPTFPCRYAWLGTTNADSVKRALGEPSGADGVQDLNSPHHTRAKVEPASARMATGQNRERR